MKLSNIEFGFDNFLAEMKKLKTEKHFDYLVTIVGEDFIGEAYQRRVPALIYAGFSGARGI